MAGRPPIVNRKQSIVRHQDIMTRAQVLQRNWNEDNLYPNCIFSTDHRRIRWLACHSLINNLSLCNTCNVLMHLGRTRRHRDGFQWRCPRCTTRRSIRAGSFFARSHMELRKIIRIIFKWTDELPMTHIMKHADVRSWSTMVDWANFCRDICVRWVANNNIQLGGMTQAGAPIEVEIDESRFFHRKYQRGRIRRAPWVFGGVERETNRCFMVPVRRRTGRRLRPLIRQHILPGTYLKHMFINAELL